MSRLFSWIHRYGSGVILLPLVAASCAAADSPRAIEYRPDAELERLQHAASVAPEVGFIRDFDISGDTMYLLDRADLVHVLQRTDSVWQKTGELGRPGAGPGEFRGAAGLSAMPDGGIVVTQAGRLQVIRSTGELESTHTLDLPCAMMLPGVAAVDGGLFVFGNCMRRGIVTDTMKAVLAWTADREQYHIVTEELSFTRDGTVGSIFSAQRAFTPADSDRHLFGTGTENCLTEIAQGQRTGTADTRPTATRQCGLVRTRFSASPPPEFERMARGSPGGMTMIWPDALPAYIDRVQVGETPVLLRPFAADSLLLQAAMPDGRDLAVAPLNGFIGCKAAGCLWMLEESEPVRMILLETADIEALLATRR